MEQLTFIPGGLSAQSGPLARFLPPLPQGVVTAWLEGIKANRADWQRGGIVLDPFGAAPRIAVEAARAGYRVLVASNNPIDRFLLDLAANPPEESELRSSLADLGAAPKGEGRIEGHVSSLYTTPCNNCQREISAQAYVWERGSTRPTSRIYHCPYCSDSGEFPITPADEARLAQLPSSQMHRSRALERVTLLDDPDRNLVEEALDVYLPRPLYALFTLINKLDGLPPTRRRPLSALLLAAFDQANTLWAHPTQRARPRQLTIPPHFREYNVWLAMEEGIKAWRQAFQGGTDHLPLTTWPALPPETGGLCLYEGRLRDLVADWAESGASLPPIQAVIAALPRPNQAYWTLSALWSGWLWGRESAARYKVVLRRRRFDWNWHCTALSSAFAYLIKLLPAQTPIFGLMGETEPGFLSAAVLGAGLVGLPLAGLALRPEEAQAQLTWSTQTGEKSTKARQATANYQEAIRTAAVQSSLEHLRTRGEPDSYIQLHATALAALAETGLIDLEFIAKEDDTEESTPAEFLTQVHNGFQSAFSFRNGFVRFHGSASSLEVGQWWLNESKSPKVSQVGESDSLFTSPQTQTAEIEPPLADRVEMEIVRLLLKKELQNEEEIERVLLAQFRGLSTPGADLLRSCLESYAEQDPPGSQDWRLRVQETPASRRADLAAVASLIAELGQRLGYSLRRQPGEERWIIWMGTHNEVVYAFYPMVSAVIGKVLSSADFNPKQCVIVYPGGRAGLISFKLRRDARLQAWVDQGWHFLKFRHLRRITENEGLSRDNLDEYLRLDPLLNQDSQISLF